MRDQPKECHQAGAKPRAVLIAGPTASGKSALARALACELNGVVINTDSMQVYRELRILTARPTPDEEAECPHLLYGHIGAAEPYSVARWLGDAEKALGAARADGRVPIFVGGTGLYFAALTDGLAAVPPIPDAVREAVRTRMNAKGVEALHAELAERDPFMARRLRATDAQRVARALEVLEATGRSLATFQAGAHAPLIEGEDVLRLVLSPPRVELYRTIDDRFTGMIARGALEEARALGDLGLPRSAPVLKALGVGPLLDATAGALSLEEAVAVAQTASRRYAKRQLTWFRARMIAWKWLNTKYLERNDATLFPNIMNLG